MPRATERTPEIPEDGRPRSADFAAKGVRTSEDFACLMSALMSDVLEGRVTAGVCNAAVNAGGKLLKIVDMAHRYGVVGENNERRLFLTGTVSENGDAKQQRIRQLEAELAALKAKA